MRRGATFAAGTPFFAAAAAFAAAADFAAAGATFFFGTGVLRAGFAGRVWRAAAFVAGFPDRAALRFTGFATRLGLADLRWLAIVTPPYR